MLVWKEGNSFINFTSLKRIQTSARFEELSYAGCICFALEVCRKKKIWGEWLCWNCKPFKIWTQFKGFFPPLNYNTSFLASLAAVFMHSELEFGLLNSQLLSLAVEISRQTDVICSQNSITALLGKFTDKSLSRHKEKDILWYNEPSLHS